MFETILTTFFNFELKEKIDLIEQKLKQKNNLFQIYTIFKFQKRY